MKTARIYTDFTSSDGYGAYLNGLKFFNRKNEELPVTDIVSVNSNKVTFKLNNVFLEKIHFKKIQEVTKYIGLILLTIMFILIIIGIVLII